MICDNDKMYTSEKVCTLYNTLILPTQLSKQVTTFQTHKYGKRPQLEAYISIC